MKEIIIDGVDVAGCKNYISVYTEDTDVEINNCCTLTYTPCQFEKKNCYYKQLKRLEQENAELKQTLQEIKSIVSNIIDSYIRPYGDYEQLKKILDLITKAEVGE